MRLSKYQVIHRISELIVQAPDPWLGLQQATELLAECTGADVCGLLSYNPSTGRNSLVAACGVLQAQVGKLTLDSERGLVGLCAKTGRTFNVDDRNACSGESMPPLPQGEHLHGMLAHPLIVSGSNIGCLILIRERKHLFSVKTLETLDEICGSLGMFILNATLYGIPLGGQEGFSFQKTKENRPRRIQRDKPIKGRSVTTGVVSGEVVKIASVDELLSGSSLQPRANTTPEAVKAEREMFFAALESARRRALRTVRELQGSLSEADCKIFEMHVMLLDDPSLRTAILKHLDEGHNLASALSSALHYFTLQYQKVADPVLRARLYDIKDIFLNIKTAADNMRTSGRAAAGTPAPAREPKSIIVVAKELLPSQLVSLPLQKVRGILCEDGGTADHVAIVARALQKSMVVGIPGIADMVRPGDSILLDANTGNCYLRPSLHLMREFATALKITRERQMLNWKDEHPASPSVVLTKDGVPIHFAGNLALLNEMPAIHHFGLESIGLYRTEFMFMIRNNLPTEEEQFLVLKRLLGLSQGLPVTVRVLDAGGDKCLPYLFEAPEDNPSLGLRGLRFLFSRPDIFLPHLRAILRASAYGKLNILFPMVADVFDLRQALESLQQARNGLRREGLPFDEKVRVGIMVEIPSAARELEFMLPLIDFVSIGTNDLTQFLFAVDRGNSNVFRWYRQCHPVILRIIRDICTLVDATPGKSVSICGELAGSRRALPLLLGAGVRNFSMSPFRVPRLRETVPGYTISECERLLDEVLATCDTEVAIMQFLAKRGIVS